MGTISAKVIKKPRSVKFCDGYRHSVLMSRNEPRVRLYGSAHYGDMPFVMYICMECAKESTDPKIVGALRGA